MPMGRDSYMPCAHATSPTIQRLKDTPAAPPKNQPTLPLNRGQSRPERECSFMVLYEPAEEGGYVVTCPALPGLVTEGETLEEARTNLGEAARMVLDANRELSAHALEGGETRESDARDVHCLLHTF